MVKKSRLIGVFYHLASLLMSIGMVQAMEPGAPELQPESAQEHARCIMLIDQDRNEYPEQSSVKALTLNLHNALGYFGSPIIVSGFILYNYLYRLQDQTHRENEFLRRFPVYLGQWKAFDITGTQFFLLIPSGISMKHFKQGKEVDIARLGMDDLGKLTSEKQKTRFSVEHLYTIFKTKK